jgi:hypothetical protein
MAISYWIDTAKDLLFATAIGAVTLEDYQAYIERLRNDPAFHWSMSGLFDGTGATLDLSSEDSRAIAELFRRELPEGAHTRRAIIVRRDVDFGTSRMFEVYANDERLQFRVFRDRQQGLEWLIGQDATAKETS